MTRLRVSVVGGVYQELVNDPWSTRLLGSGLRAAATVTSLGGSEVTLHTRMDLATMDEFLSVTAAFGVIPDHIERAESIGFTYPTPIDIPAQTHTFGDSAGALVVDERDIVAFGMVEGPWHLTAERAVVDPQHARLDQCGLHESKIDRLCVVLNAAETQRLAGSVSVVAAESLRTDFGAEALIVKRGALGAWVITESGVTTIGSYRTRTVSPIGSGDAFTAGFAHAWMVQDLPVDEAAQFASRVAAAQSLHGTPAVKTTFVDAVAGDAITGSPGRVYLAGPFFTAPERWLVDRARLGLQSLGVEVFSPLHEIGFGGDEVAAPDLDGLDSCHAVFALLDGADPGTLFEIGWARRTGIPVVGYSSNPGSAHWTMLRGTDCEVSEDFASSIYHAAWDSLQPKEGQP